MSKLNIVVINKSLNFINELKSVLRYYEAPIEVFTEEYPGTLEKETIVIRKLKSTSISYYDQNVNSYKKDIIRNVNIKPSTLTLGAIKELVKDKNINSVIILDYKGNDILDKNYTFNISEQLVIMARNKLLNVTNNIIFLYDKIENNEDLKFLGNNNRIVDVNGLNQDGIDAINRFDNKCSIITYKEFERFELAKLVSSYTIPSLMQHKIPFKELCENIIEFDLPVKEYDSNMVNYGYIHINDKVRISNVLQSSYKVDKNPTIKITNNTKFITIKGLEYLDKILENNLLKAKTLEYNIIYNKNKNLIMVVYND